MARSNIGRLAWILVVIVAGVIGFAAGARRGHDRMIGALQTEAAGNLVQRIETLSRLRMTETPAAIDQLEREMDQLTRSIATNPGADRRVLAYVKTYLSVAPPSGTRAQQLEAALEGVPVLEPGDCDTALRELLLSKRAQASEPGK